MSKGTTKHRLSGTEIAGFLVTGLLIVAIIAGAITTYQSSNLFDQVSTEWNQQQQRSEDQGRHIADILRHFGYGGFIHNFKNYVLRQDPAYRQRLDEDLTNVWSAVASLQGLLKDEEDLRALDQLRRVIRQYQENIAVADEAVRRGWSPSQTDQRVRVDDAPALQALWSLRDSWIRQLEDDRERFGGLVQRGMEETRLSLFLLPLLLIAGGAILWILRRLIREIEDRRRAEEEVARGELIVESLAHMGVGISVMNADLELVACNGEFLEVLGFPAELSTPGTPIREMFRLNAERGEYGDGDIEALVEERLELARKFEPHRFERTRPDGTILEIRGTPLPHGGFVTTYTNITARKLAEMELAQKEIQLFTALDSVSAGILFFDKDLTIRLFNDAMRERLELPEGLIMEGLPMQALWRIRAVRGDYGDGDPEKIVSRMIDNYTNAEFEARETHVTASGKHIDTYRARTADGGTVIVYNDITERVLTEERLKKNEADLTRYIGDIEMSRRRLEDRTQELVELAEKYAVEKDRAEASEKSKSEFLASMSHEIRTPMTGVLGMADILLESELTPLQRDTVLKVKGAGLSLLTIINDILDLSKLEADKLHIEAIDFNLPSVINAAVDLIRPKADDKGLYVSVDMRTSLPRSVRGDPTRIRQVLINLVGNAVKFTHDGGVTIKVRHDEQADGGYLLRFAVSDTGIGISEEVRECLFQDFTQADASTTRRYEGTGLGLAISKRLTGLMDGDIGVESQTGEGSTFWFTVSVAEATTDIAEAASNLAVQSFQATRPIKILVAEDNQLNQLILNSVLEPLGHELTFVGTGAAAVAAVDETTFDLILMDVRMPEMSGPDATRVIRQLDGPKAHIPIIAVTADVLQENIASYLSTGMNAAVSKPIDRGELMARMNEVLGEEVHVPATLGPEEIKADACDQRRSAPSGDSDDQTPMNADVGDFIKKLEALSS